jgi:hypothetical protein
MPSAPLLLFQCGKGAWNLIPKRCLVKERIHKLGDILHLLQSAKISDQIAYSTMCKDVKGVGHLQAMQTIQLSALLGIVQPKHFLFAAVSAGNYGPSKFLARHSEVAQPYLESYRGDLKQFRLPMAALESAFSNVLVGLQKCGRKIERVYVENGMCIDVREEEGKPKKEVLLADNDGRMQTFFRVTWLSSAKMEAQIEYWNCGGWHLFNTAIVPFYLAATKKGTTALRLGSLGGLPLQPLVIK